eukprot:PLAT1173.2.p1 GENE.PLAT1173.2~~PLAT1173.2.p1  ORF type:complete len:2879 (-),score=1834.45 PLAT1173.2:116-8752(-)
MQTITRPRAGRLGLAAVMLLLLGTVALASGDAAALRLRAGRESVGMWAQLRTQVHAAMAAGSAGGGRHKALLGALKLVEQLRVEADTQLRLETELSGEESSRCSSLRDGVAAHAASMTEQLRQLRSMRALLAERAALLAARAGQGSRTAQATVAAEARAVALNASLLAAEETGLHHAFDAARDALHSIAAQCVAARSRASDAAAWHAQQQKLLDRMSALLESRSDDFVDVLSLAPPLPTGGTGPAPPTEAKAALEAADEEAAAAGAALAAVKSKQQAAAAAKAEADAALAKAQEAAAAAKAKLADDEKAEAKLAAALPAMAAETKETAKESVKAEAARAKAARVVALDDQRVEAERVPAPDRAPLTAAEHKLASDLRERAATLRHFHALEEHMLADPYLKMSEEEAALIGAQPDAATRAKLTATEKKLAALNATVVNDRAAVAAAKAAYDAKAGKYNAAQKLAKQLAGQIKRLDPAAAAARSDGFLLAPGEAESPREVLAKAAATANETAADAKLAADTQRKSELKAEDLLQEIRDTKASLVKLTATALAAEKKEATARDTLSHLVKKVDAAASKNEAAVGKQKFAEAEKEKSDAEADRVRSVAEADGELKALLAGAAPTPDSKNVGNAAGALAAKLSDSALAAEAAKEEAVEDVQDHSQRIARLLGKLDDLLPKLRKEKAALHTLSDVEEKETDAAMAVEQAAAKKRAALRADIVAAQGAISAAEAELTAARSKLRGQQDELSGQQSEARSLADRADKLRATVRKLCGDGGMPAFLMDGLNLTDDQAACQAAARQLDSTEEKAAAVNKTISATTADIAASEKVLPQLTAAVSAAHAKRAALAPREKALASASASAAAAGARADKADGGLTAAREEEGRLAAEVAELRSQLAHERAQLAAAEKAAETAEGQAAGMLKEAREEAAELKAAAKASLKGVIPDAPAGASAAYKPTQPLPLHKTVHEALREELESSGVPSLDDDSEEDEGDEHEGIAALLPGGYAGEHDPLAKEHAQLDEADKTLAHQRAQLVAARDELAAARERQAEAVSQLPSARDAVQAGMLKTKLSLGRLMTALERLREQRAADIDAHVVAAQKHESRLREFVTSMQLRLNSLQTRGLTLLPDVPQLDDELGLAPMVHAKALVATVLIRPGALADYAARRGLRRAFEGDVSDFLSIARGRVHVASLAVGSTSADADADGVKITFYLLPSEHDGSNDDGAHSSPVALDGLARRFIAAAADEDSGLFTVAGRVISPSLDTSAPVFARDVLLKADSLSVAPAPELGATGGATAGIGIESDAALDDVDRLLTSRLSDLRGRAEQLQDNLARRQAALAKHGSISTAAVATKHLIAKQLAAERDVLQKQRVALNPQHLAELAPELAEPENEEAHARALADRAERAALHAVAEAAVHVEPMPNTTAIAAEAKARAAKAVADLVHDDGLLSEVPRKQAHDAVVVPASKEGVPTDGDAAKAAGPRPDAPAGSPQLAAWKRARAIFRITAKLRKLRARVRSLEAALKSALIRQRGATALRDARTTAVDDASAVLADAEHVTDGEGAPTIVPAAHDQLAIAQRELQAAKAAAKSADDAVDRLRAELAAARDAVRAAEAELARLRALVIEAPPKEQRMAFPNVVAACKVAVAAVKVAESKQWEVKRLQHKLRKQEEVVVELREEMASEAVLSHAHAEVATLHWELAHARKVAEAAVNDAHTKQSVAQERAAAALDEHPTELDTLTSILERYGMGLREDMDSDAPAALTDPLDNELHAQGGKTADEQDEDADLPGAPLAADRAEKKIVEAAQRAADAIAAREQDEQDDDEQAPASVDYDDSDADDGDDVDGDVFDGDVLDDDVLYDLPSDDEDDDADDDDDDSDAIAYEPLPTVIEKTPVEQVKHEIVPPKQDGHIFHDDPRAAETLGGSTPVAPSAAGLDILGDGDAVAAAAKKRVDVPALTVKLTLAIDAKEVEKEPLTVKRSVQADVAKALNAPLARIRVPAFGRRYTPSAPHKGDLLAVFVQILPGAPGSRPAQSLATELVAQAGNVDSRLLAEERTVTWRIDVTRKLKIVPDTVAVPLSHPAAAEVTPEPEEDESVLPDSLTSAAEEAVTAPAPAGPDGVRANWATGSAFNRDPKGERSLLLNEDGDEHDWDDMEPAVLEENVQDTVDRARERAEAADAALTLRRTAAEGLSEAAIDTRRAYEEDAEEHDAQALDIIRGSGALLQMGFTTGATGTADEQLQEHNGDAPSEIDARTAEATSDSARAAMHEAARIKKARDAELAKAEALKEDADDWAAKVRAAEAEKAAAEEAARLAKEAVASGRASAAAVTGNETPEAGDKEFTGTVEEARKQAERTAEEAAQLKEEAAVAKRNAEAAMARKAALATSGRPEALAAAEKEAEKALAEAQQLAAASEEATAKAEKARKIADAHFQKQVEQQVIDKAFSDESEDALHTLPDVPTLGIADGEDDDGDDDGDDGDDMDGGADADDDDGDCEDDGGDGPCAAGVLASPIETAPAIKLAAPGVIVDELAEKPSSPPATDEKTAVSSSEAAEEGEEAAKDGDAAHGQQLEAQESAEEEQEDDEPLPDHVAEVQAAHKAAAKEVVDLSQQSVEEDSADYDSPIGDLDAALTADVRLAAPTGSTGPAEVISAPEEDEDVEERAVERVRQFVRHRAGKRGSSSTLAPADLDIAAQLAAQELGELGDSDADASARVVREALSEELDGSSGPTPLEAGQIEEDDTALDRAVVAAGGEVEQPDAMEKESDLYVPTDELPAEDKKPAGLTDEQRKAKCAARKGCGACLADDECGWCSTTDSCLPADCTTCDLFEKEVCSADPCHTYNDCSSCAHDPMCGWCASTGNCIDGTAVGPLAKQLCDVPDWRYKTC